MHNPQSTCPRNPIIYLLINEYNKLNAIHRYKTFHFIFAQNTHNMLLKSVADPGFPVGGVAPVRGGVDLRRGHFLVKMYVKTKELGPIGSLDPPMEVLPISA